jgi:hypothetical protein
MKTAIMQPYIFPYLGYFQLVNCVDTFVFYDDVNFIKRGWINRNKILINGKEVLLSFPCVKPSQNKLIKDVEINFGSKEYLKIFETIKQSYKNAPYYIQVTNLLELIFKKEYENISELASTSVIMISEYLNLNTEFLYSSISFKETKGQDRADRLINITKSQGRHHYVNALGGQEIYSQSHFLKKGIKLNFLRPTIQPYKQFDNEFISNLSIIDVLMFNSTEKVKYMLNEFKLI